MWLLSCTEPTRRSILLLLTVLSYPVPTQCLILPEVTALSCHKPIWQPILLLLTTLSCLVAFSTGVDCSELSTAYSAAYFTAVNYYELSSAHSVTYLAFSNRTYSAVYDWPGTDRDWLLPVLFGWLWSALSTVQECRVPIPILNFHYNLQLSMSINYLGIWKKSCIDIKKWICLPFTNID